REIGIDAFFFAEDCFLARKNLAGEGQPTREDLGTGVEEATAAGFKLYPNPVTGDRLIVELPGSTALQALTIYDVQGRPVRQVAVNGRDQRHEVATQGISEGLYVIRLQLETGAVLHQRIVIGS
ncbi:MAG: T9SS type A sorting domain-containing protein, partial [Bacteroidota bacterium]